MHFFIEKFTAKLYPGKDECAKYVTTQIVITKSVYTSCVT